MLKKIVSALRARVVGWARSIGSAVRRLLAPASKAVPGLARDAARPRMALIAENALLRQRLIVARRKTGSTQLRDVDRAMMVPFPVETGKVVALPVLGGLHHDYRMAA